MPGRRVGAFAVALLLTGLIGGDTCRGQNDWQYPDPYFGVLEIEKSRTPAPPGEHGASTRAGSTRWFTSGPRPRVRRGRPWAVARPAPPSPQSASPSR